MTAGKQRSKSTNFRDISSNAKIVKAPRVKLTLEVRFADFSNQSVFHFYLMSSFD